MARRRLDAQLVRLGLARSREQAQELIAAGRVRVGGSVAQKPATQVGDDAPVVVVPGEAGPEYASRGAHKLVGALAAFTPHGLVVKDRAALDAGASTGGFTDVLLRAGAKSVVAVDVGYGQLAWSLRTDPRVIVMDRVNVRSLKPDDLPYRPGLVVADLSFIPLGVVLPALAACADPEGDMVLMVKPQFEVGRENLGSRGVVRDPGLRAGAVTGVAERAWELGWGLRGVCASPLPGPQGNVEYFVHLRRDAPEPAPELIIKAVEEGPQ